MEVFFGIIGLLYLVSPAILIGIAIAHHRKFKGIEAELKSLRSQLDYQERKTVKTAPAEPPPVQEKPVVTPRPAMPMEPEPVSAMIHSLYAETSGETEPEKAPDVEESVPVTGPGPQPEPVPAGPTLGGRIREFLDSIGLLPPQATAERGRESILMQWWVPRVGGLLALLSALFFGVYINQSTSALFKFIELLAVSLAICGGGRLLERKYPAFGHVLLVTGMVMLFLTSVAGYLLPATRVTENPLAGALAQAAVLGWICWVGYLRRSTGMVMLAFHFGYFVALFLVWESMREGALIAGLVLFVMGALLSRKELFLQLTWVIIPGSFIVQLAFFGMTAFQDLLLPRAVSLIIYINLVFAGVALLHATRQMGGLVRSRILLSLCSTLAVVSTGVVFRALFPDELEWASLVLGINFLGFAISLWALRSCGFFSQLLLVKGSLLVAIWAVLHYSGDLRWMALALETVPLAYVARRARAVALELVAWAVVIWSLVLYQVGLSAVPAQFSFHWWMVMAYPAVILLGLAYLLPVFRDHKFDIRDITRNWAYLLVPFVAVFLWYRVIHDTPLRSFDASVPFVLIAYAAAGLSLVPLLSRWMLLVLSGLAYAMACVHFWEAPYSPILLGALLLAACGAVYKLSGQERRIHVFAENAVYPLILVAISLYVLQVLGDWKGQAMVAGLMGAALLFLGMVRQARHLGSWSFIPLMVFLITEEPAAGAGILGLGNLAAGLAWVLLPALYRPVERCLGWGATAAVWSYIAVFLYWIQIVFFGDPEAGWMAGSLSLVAWPLPCTAPVSGGRCRDTSSGRSS